MKKTYSVDKKIFFYLFLFFTLPFFSQNPRLSEKAKISVITCDVGNESYSLFGHTALRIKDSISHIDVVYNYGAFDFQTPNFVAKFAKGNLIYFAVADSYSNFINEYLYLKRSVFEQELNLSTALKQQLFENLNESLRSGDSQYTYKFIDKNCTSMLIEIINKTLGSNVIHKEDKSSISYRSILFPYFNDHFYEQLGTSIIFGTKVDQESDHIFLPFDLMNTLKTTKFEGKALVTNTEKTVDAEKIHLRSWWNNWYSYLIVLGMIMALNNAFLNRFYFFVSGAIGVVFLFLGFYSEHLELANNYNVLLLNPLLVLLAFVVNSKKRLKLSSNLAYGCLGSLLVYLLILINKEHLILVLPLIVANAYLLVALILKNKKALQ